MRARVALLASLLIASASAVVVLSEHADAGSPAGGPRQRDFVVNGSDGYGTQDCLSGKKDCGRIVADAWCESKGFKAALAYRQLDPEEVTGSVPSPKAGTPSENFLISCRD